MTRPKPPRLPELAGMTEAGFNRVVEMIQWQDFVPSGTFGVTFLAKEIVAAEKAWKEWRASLPKTRNKKQRKADAKRAALHESAREQFEAIFPPVHCCECEKKLDLFDDYQRDGKRYCAEHFVAPLQRLMRFAADTGVPVSFEIAEKAMKGGG